MTKKIELTRPEKEALVYKIKMYFREELEYEIGAFPAEFLLDFFLDEMGPAIYNKAISDAHQYIDEKLTNLVDELYYMEQ